ncbi:CsbD family protein [Kozakia baliensis]|uniref:CsbD family protein n=1 Tax=Kozakia baliensis TaxID=153496 RepID=UPI000496A20E|nr:CsbD family protein [Kozakia baliensis]AOX20233.1 general stress protein [Kozakia baliensis]
MSDTTGKKAEGLLDEAKGRVKDAAGGLTGDAKLQAEGKVDQLSGMAQQEFADLYDDAESNLEKATAFVQDRPLISLGLSILFGTVIGALFFGRRRK